ncbi:MAG: response regulator [Candidatus Pacearchaeota archaeon]
MTSKRNSILIASSDLMNRSLDKVLLARTLKEGYEFEMFENGEKLSNRLENSKNIRAVILDRDLPKISEYEVLKNYAKQLDEIDFFMFYSGNDEIGERALELGAKDYFTRPDPTAGRRIKKYLEG